MSRASVADLKVGIRLEAVLRQPLMASAWSIFGSRQTDMTSGVITFENHLDAEGEKA